MTINGPAPTILAFFMNTAIEQQLTKFRADNKRDPTDDELAKIGVDAGERARHGAGGHPEGRPGQNTCIFSTEFSLKVMGDIQQYFVQNKVRNFYSVSISGYHIAEAGANPISQLAFTLSNGFTVRVEAYLARGMHIDDLRRTCRSSSATAWTRSTPCSAVARRIWAVAMREKYGANDRSQKLKYHIQTSGLQPARAGDSVQRHPHHAAGVDRRLRQLQLIAPTRSTKRSLRRPKKRAPRDGDPAHHQPRMGPRQKRNLKPGRIHHRRD